MQPAGGSTAPMASAASGGGGVVRRGRGTFQHRLRTEEHEQQLQQHHRDAAATADTQSNVTSVVTSVMLPLSTLGPRSRGELLSAANTATTSGNSGTCGAAATTAATVAGDDGTDTSTAGQPATATDTVAAAATTTTTATGGDVNNNSNNNNDAVGDDDDDVEAALAVLTQPLKKDIPLTTMPTWRDNFGAYGDGTGSEATDTVRQLFFRGEKRRRYCVIVGDLQTTERVVTLNLFGHRGLKPFQLQNKLIRLINLSIGRPRVRRNEDGTVVTAEAAADGDTKSSNEDQDKEQAEAVSAHSDKADVATTATTTTTAAACHDAAQYTDVDHYLESVDEVVPLTVQHAADGANASGNNNSNSNSGGGGGRELSLANSPVLTARYFDSLTEYFLREFRFLFSMADVRTHNVTIDVSLGAAYYCLPRHFSYSTPLRHATFGEFVERMNQELLQLYFIRDCPACVSRAVDMECGDINHEATLRMVRIVFFSNERQSRSVARAMWDSERNAFRLLDVENVGVTFNWTVFSLDETSAVLASRRQQQQQQQGGITTSAGATTASTSSGNNNSSSSAGHDAVMRNKTVAYPFEVEFRAFRRWRQSGEHPAGQLAQAILDRLSHAENNFIHHGSSVGYERMDLTDVCEIDAASEDFNVEHIVVDHITRSRPRGTDILVDNTTSLFIENFAAARQLKEKIAQYGASKVAAMQSATNNNYLRGQTRRYARGMAGRGRYGRGSGGRDDDESLYSGSSGGGGGGWPQASFASTNAAALPDDVMAEALKPPSKLTFFRSRGSTIHWKFRPTRTVEENIAPMAEALRFVQLVLNTANDIERTSARGGVGPEAI